MKKNITKLILISLFILGFFNVNLNYCYSSEKTPEQKKLLEKRTQTLQQQGVIPKDQPAGSKITSTADLTSSSQSSSQSSSPAAGTAGSTSSSPAAGTAGSTSSSPAAGTAGLENSTSSSTNGEKTHSNATSGSERFDNRNTNKDTQANIDKYNELNKGTENQIMPNEKGEYSQEDIKKLQKYCGASEDGMSGDETTKACDKKFASSGDGKIKVIVTEKIPGLKCDQKGTGTGYKKTYKCTVDKGFGSVLKMLEGLVKYVTFIVILIAILMLIISGIRISIEGNKDQAKKNFQRVITGIVLLFLVGFILNSIAPWFYGG